MGGGALARLLPSGLAGLGRVLVTINGTSHSGGNGTGGTSVLLTGLVGVHGDWSSLWRSVGVIAGHLIVVRSVVDSVRSGLLSAAVDRDCGHLALLVVVIRGVRMGSEHVHGNRAGGETTTLSSLRGIDVDDDGGSGALSCGRGTVNCVRCVHIHSDRTLGVVSSRLLRKRSIRNSSNAAGAGGRVLVALLVAVNRRGGDATKGLFGGLGVPVSVTPLVPL